MKKVLVFTLVFAMLFAFAACAGKNTDDKDTSPSVSDADASQETTQPDENENEGVPNPVREVTSTDEFTKIGLTLLPPENAENVRLSIISDSIAQIDFTSGGVEYTLRASRSTEDISGLFGTDLSTRKLEDGAVLTHIGSGDDTYRKIAWSADGVSYTLTNVAGATDDAIIAVYGSRK